MKPVRVLRCLSTLAGLCLVLAYCAAPPVAQKPIILQPVAPTPAPHPSPRLTEKNVNTPAPSPTPTAPGASSAQTGATPTPSPEATTSEILPPLDITMLSATIQISDYSLNNIITDKLPPARSASLRAVEMARQELMAGDKDEAIRTLGRAISIDPSDPYAYFYLGRAYFVRGDYNQATTFLQRAAIGFGDNPAWLGEAYGFEGNAYEASGRTQEAGAAYKRALEAAPNNRVARLGIGRVTPTVMPVASPGASPAPGGEPAPGSLIQPPPDVPPPPPPPAPSAAN